MEFSEIYKHFDQQEEQNLLFRRSLENKLSREYLTFYEKVQNALKLEAFTVSIIFGVILFAIHLFASLQEDTGVPYLIIEDFSFFLAILNAVGLYLVYRATDTFREFIVNLFQLTKDDNVKTAEWILKAYKERFLGGRTIIFGVCFGVVNCILALAFGICYQVLEQYYLLATFLLQVFTIGFIGGITVSATVVVVKIINRVSLKDDINLAYFYPDKCAGTLVIGNILFIFSIYFIIIGVLIFLFIHNYQWVRMESGVNNYYVNALIVFWKVFPFVLSGIIFFLPTKKINAILKEYKMFEQLKIRRRMNYLTGIIMSLESDNKEAREKIEILDNHYQKLERIDKEISELNTWPYNLAYRTTFLSIFLPVVIGIILELSREIVSGLFES